MQNTRFLRRLGAIIYDALLLFALLMLATVPFIIVRSGEAVEPGGNLVYQLVLVAVIYAYLVGYWTTRGRTLGMQSWGLQIISNDGQIPGIAPATLRFVAAILSWVPLGLGFFWQLWDKDGLTWHDRLSGTRTVYIPKSKTEQDEAG